MKKLFIIGTPRSGTSFWGRMFDLAGAYLGKLTEFAEDPRICIYHEGLINHWVTPIEKAPQITPEIIHRLEQFRDAFIREAQAQGKSVWGWKEPRGLYVHHLWDIFFDKEARLFVTFRHPQEFADGCYEVRQENANHPNAIKRDVDYWIALWVKYWTVFFEEWGCKIKSNSMLEENTRFSLFAKERMEQNDQLFMKLCQELNLRAAVPSAHFKLEGRAAKHKNYSFDNVDTDIPKPCRSIWLRLIKLYEKQFNGATQ